MGIGSGWGARWGGGGPGGREKIKKKDVTTHTEASRVPVCASNPGAGAG